MNERKLTFGGRQALSIIGSLDGLIYPVDEKAAPNPKALREEDRLILKEVDGKSSAREILAASGLDYQDGLHSLAWLAKTGFIYSSRTLEFELTRQADRLALFVDLFTDPEHDHQFWLKELEKARDRVADLPQGIGWEGLAPQITEPLCSPQEVADYFLELFVRLYDRAEEIYGAQAVLAKRVLLDVKPG